MKTSVIFVSHIISEETLFRYNHLKSGCVRMGYDLYWAIDTMAIPEEDLPKDDGLRFYPISYLRYELNIQLKTILERIGDQ